MWVITNSLYDQSLCLSNIDVYVLNQKIILRLVMHVILQQVWKYLLRVFTLLVNFDLLERRHSIGSDHSVWHDLKMHEAYPCVFGMPHLKVSNDNALLDQRVYISNFKMLMRLFKQGLLVLQLQWTKRMEASKLLSSGNGEKHSTSYPTKVYC